jgi:hypothetical protein
VPPKDYVPAGGANAFYTQETPMSKATKPQGGLVIASVDVKNFKRIKCVSFNPKEAGLTTLGGMNKQGKTSGINAIQMGFSGGKFKPSDLHNDTGGPGDYAEVNITTTNGYAVRIFGKNGTIEVTDPKGKKGGITLFGDAVSSFATDLRPFLNANATEKYKIAVLAMGIGDLLEEIEGQRKTAYDNRTIANGVAKNAAAALKAATPPDPKVKIPDEVDVVQLSAEIQKANKSNNKRQEMIDDKQEMEKQSLTLAEEIDDLEAQLIAKKNALVDLNQTINNYPLWPEEIDLAPLEAKMATANATNTERTKLIQIQTDYDAKVKASNDATKAAQEAQKALDEVIQKKHNAVTELGEIQNPDIVLEGGQLLYKGKAWDCISGAEEFIVAIEFGYATNKGCDFVLIDGLERMDTVERAKLDAWGGENGAQLIGTVVTGDPSQCSIYIEDGRVLDKD